MCKSKELNLDNTTLSNAAAAIVIDNNNWVVFRAGASNVTICDAAAASIVPIHTPSVGALVFQAPSTTLGSISGLKNSMSITIQQNAPVNYMGQTYGEGLYTLEVDGTMHLVGDSTASASAAAASPADLD